MRGERPRCFALSQGPAQVSVGNPLSKPAGLRELSPGSGSTTSPPCLGAGKSPRSCPCAGCRMGLAARRSRFPIPALHRQARGALGHREGNHVATAAAAAPTRQVTAVKQGVTSQIPWTCLEAEGRPVELSPHRTHRSIAHLPEQLFPSSRQLEGRIGGSEGHLPSPAAWHHPPSPAPSWSPAPTRLPDVEVGMQDVTTGRRALAELLLGHGTQVLP